MERVASRRSKFLLCEIKMGGGSILDLLPCKSRELLGLQGSLNWPSWVKFDAEAYEIVGTRCCRPNRWLKFEKSEKITSSNLFRIFASTFSTLIIAY